MNRTMRTLSRTAGMALALSGAALFVAGQANANDRAVVVSCTDQSAGTWTVAVTFSSIEVKADRPVTVSLGSAGRITRCLPAASVLKLTMNRKPFVLMTNVG